jgi:hypothetical protein
MKHRRRLGVFFVLIVAACAGPLPRSLSPAPQATEIALSPATPTDTPAPVASATPDPFTRFHALMQGGLDTITETHQVFLDILLAQLRTLPGGLNDLAKPDGLAQLESHLPSEAFWEGGQPIKAVDLDKDGQLELIVAGPVSPASLIRQTASGFVVQDLPGPRFPDRAVWPTIGQVSDLNGDGRLDIVLAYVFISASAYPKELVVVGQAADGWKDWGRIQLNDWAGGGEWGLVAQPDGTHAITTTCSIFGVFDVKMVAHLLQHDTYRWDGGRFSLFDSKQDSPANKHQTINLAEAALRSGAYRAALDIYRRVLTESDLADEFNGVTYVKVPDWVAYAAWRSGQLYTLLRERSAALDMLAQAEQAGSTIGRLATRFRQTYEVTDKPATAWRAVLSDTEIYSDTYFSRGNLAADFADPFWVLYPGMSLAAVLNEQPQAIESAEALRAAWTQAGLTAGSILLADLDGDGQAEIVAQQTWPSVAFDYIDQGHQVPMEQESAITWILDRGPDGWFAVPLGYGYGEQGEIEKSVPIPGTQRQAVRLSSSVWGWDGQQAVSLDPQTWTAVTDPARCPLRWP